MPLHKSYRGIALGATFPRNLRLEDQGRFAIGYYHERFSHASALPEPPADDTTDTTAPEA
jgi:CRISPR-associated protein Csd1